MGTLFWIESGQLKAFRRKIYQSKRWLNTRQYILDLNPFCDICKKEAATDVDHVIPLSKIYLENIDIEMAYDVDNLRGLCKSCHSKKSYTEGLGRNRIKKEVVKGVTIKGTIVSK